MPRGIIQLRDVEPDPKYQSVLVAKLVNQIMERGKKTAARKVVYDAFDKVAKTTGQDPVTVLEKAMENVTPQLEVRSRRVGGATYQVPVEVKGNRRTSLALRWILAAARSAKGRGMAPRLADELVSASKNEGSAVKKKEDTHRMAESNRAFAHFAW